MADVTDVLAIPFPEGGDTFTAAAVQSLAERVDEAPGIESLTSAEIAALASAQKPAGRVVYNSTTGKLQVSNGTSFVDTDAVATAALPTASVRAATVSTSSYTTGGVAVSFSSALASVPLLVIGQTVNVGSATPLHIMPFGVTTSGFSYKAFDNLGLAHERDAGSPVLFDYLAVIV